MERTAVGSLVDAVVLALGGAGSGAVAAYLDEATLLHMPGGSGLAGDYQGREAICQLLDRMTDASSGTLRFETACTTAKVGGGVRLCGQLVGQRLERSLHMRASVEAIIAGRTIREAWLACADQSAWDAFWT